MKWSAIVLACSVAACSPGADLPPIGDAASSNAYQLGAGDKLRIITYGDDNLTGDFTVNGGGDVEIPLLGAVHAAGRTVPQLQASIAHALSARGLLNKPSVSVEVSEYRPIFVLGEVAKPGQYPYQPDMTVVTAVAVAGGYTYRAVKARVEITRTRDGTVQHGQAQPDALLRPGDVVTVLERYF
jgi:polysaccharide export outer membrane protein